VIRSLCLLMRAARAVAGPGAFATAPVRVAVRVALAALTGLAAVGPFQPVAAQDAAIGAAEVARAKPDGHTLLLGFDGTIAIAPVIQANVGFDPLKDFSSIARLADVGLVVAVHPSIPARDMRQLIDWSKANPGKLSFASPGPGSTAHLAGEQLRLEAGLDWLHVPYGASGSGKFVNDLIGGSVPAALISIAVAAPYIREGRIVGVGVPSLAPNVAIPDVPTFAVAGLERFNVSSWFALLGPAGMSSAGRAAEC